MSDFDEFYRRVGAEVPIYRKCILCDDLIIVDPEHYEKPQAPCDPDPNGCVYSSPYCICKGLILFDEEYLADCSYPSCPCEQEYREEEDD